VEDEGLKLAFKPSERWVIITGSFK